jgi:hypothetical protein
VRWFFAIVALAAFSGAPALSAGNPPPQPQATSQDLTPAVAKVVEFAKSHNYKTLAYFELDDSLPDNIAKFSLTILIEAPGYKGIFAYKGAEWGDFDNSLAAESLASGKNGWRQIVIVVDKDNVSVRRGPSPGPSEAIDARLRAEAHRVFPEYTGQ